MKNRWDTALRVLTAFLVVVLIVITVALEIQVQTRNTRLARLDVAVQETKTASHQALTAANGSKKALTDALAQVQSSGSGGPSGADVKAALVKIDVIEQQVQMLLDRR